MERQEPPPRIALVGLMGTGKSTVGRILARRLGRPFVDLDRRIEERAGASVAALFDREGEAAFRDRESAALRALAASPEPLVVACGGGVVLREENRLLLRSAFATVWLRGAPAMLAERLGNDPERPLLAAGDPRRVLEALEAERRPFYTEVARWCVTSEAGEAPEERVRELLVLLGVEPWR